MLPELTIEEKARYARHILLHDVGEEGQRRLKGASVLIIGVGGLGSPISMYLAAAGVGRIGIVDFDVVETSNLQRQIIHSTINQGKLKVESARQRLVELNPYINIDIFAERFSLDNAEEIALSYDILIDGSDNLMTRYLINDVAVLQGKPYIYGSIFEFEGQVCIFDAGRGPCYRCAFPEPPPPGALPLSSQIGVYGALPGIIGSLQAMEAIKLIMNIGIPLIGQLMLFNGLDMSFQKVNLKKNLKCKICASHPIITCLTDGKAYYQPY